MSCYRHILLALDYGEFSNVVADTALQLAQQQGARLSLVHVLDNIAMPDTEYGTPVSLQTRSANPELEAEKEKFRRLVEELNIAPNDAWLVWGNPRREIVELAGKIGADLIVSGSHGRRGLHALLGSTANAVLHHARCDVMAVRIGGTYPRLELSGKRQ